MRRSYRPLLSLRVTHGYYAGRCDDFDFVVPSEATRLMGGALRARVIDGRFQVFFEADEFGAPLRPLPVGVLRIGLKLANPRLYNFTAAESLPPTGMVACYRNATSRTALDPPEPCRMVGTVLSHALRVTARPMTATLRDASGAAAEAITVSDADQTEVSFSLASRAEGSLTLGETAGGAPLVTSYELHPELLAQGVFGLVAITLDESVAAAAPDFEVPLAARRETLRYYVVARRYRDDEVQQLTVVDGGATADGREALSFTRVRPEAFLDDDLPASLVAQDGAQVVLFRSNVVERRASARRRIALRRNGTELVASLPQPGPDQPHAHMIIHVSR